MCGIIGFTWDDEQLVRKAVKKIKHRGPDRLATFTDKGISLGHARLSVIDLSEGSNQPMTNGYGDTIIYNGEVYNFAQVRRELEKFGHRFETKGDTEVLLDAWSAWGIDSLKRLNGMFAFAVHEPRNKRLSLVRDRYGIKPLFYAHILLDGEPQLIFGSEIQAVQFVLGELGLRPEVSSTGLRDYFTLRHTLDHTLIEDIRKVPPGNVLTFDYGARSAELQPWYLLPQPRFVKTGFAKKRIRELLEDSVQLRTIADVPVGFFLSGGLDSGIVTKLAVDQKRILGESPGSVKTFSVGFEHAHELAQARQSADALGTDHHELIVSDSDALKAVHEAVLRSGEPVNDAAFIPTLLISKYARKHVTCVQAGEGADEVFGGYDRYAYLRHAGKAAPFAKAAGLLSKNPLVHKLARMSGKSEFERHVEAGRIFCEEDVGGPAHDVSAYKKYFVGDSKLQRAASFDIRTVLANDFFVKADAMPMTVALEERVPFMDHRVVELGLSVKDSDKIRGNRKKLLLRKAFPDLPGAVRKRKKRGYETPIDQWFGPQGKLRTELDQLLDMNTHKLYDKEKARKLLSSFKPGKSYMQNFTRSQQLYGLLAFEIWYNENIAHKS